VLIRLVCAGSLLLTVVALGAQTAVAKTTTITFPYIGVFGSEGVPEIWIVPKQVYRATFHLYGAQGGNGKERGGRGGEVSDTLKIKPGEILEINVGGQPHGLALFRALGGFNGGGVGGHGPAQSGGGGGGASDIRTAPFRLSDRLLVAGGGGGGGGYYCAVGYCGAGGSGGGQVGAAGGQDACNTIYGSNGYGTIIGELIGTVNVTASGGGQRGGGAGASCGSGYDNGAGGKRGKGGRGGSIGAQYCGNGQYANIPALPGGGGGGGGGYYGGGGGIGGSAVTEYSAYGGQGPPSDGSCTAWGGGGGAGGSSHGPSGARFRTGVRGGSGKVTVTYTTNCSRGAICVRGAPGAPTRVTAVASDRSALVAFAPPKHWPPLTGYEVKASPGDAHATGKQSPITIRGLKNGTRYTFTVTATNLVGTGPKSKRSNAVTPEPPPGAPTDVSAVAGDAEAVVSWTAPKSAGPIITYKVIASSGRVEMATGSPATIHGLKDGTTETFKVMATNAFGDGPLSKSSNPVTPVGPPDRPTGAVAIAGNGQANVSFLVPFSRGSPIENYTVTVQPGGETVTGTGPPMTITGLANGTTYTFTVTATNALGTSPPSAPSNPVTPITVPGAPTAVSATITMSPGEASVSFTAPASNGGSAITSYTVKATSTNGGTPGTGSGSGSPIVVTGLESGRSYTFTVAATNSAGTGPQSAPSSPPLQIP
jgi:Glycine rich protein/Fibronectin type III domain